MKMAHCCVLFQTSKFDNLFHYLQGQDIENIKKTQPSFQGLSSRHPRRTVDGEMKDSAYEVGKTQPTNND